VQKELLGWQNSQKELDSVGIEPTTSRKFDVFPRKDAKRAILPLDKLLEGDSLF
jgi:hypothetical protein